LDSSVELWAGASCQRCMERKSKKDRILLW
jgi:hypothetical protein